MYINQDICRLWSRQTGRKKKKNKIDPLNTVALSFLVPQARRTSVIQIMIQAHRSESFKDDALFFRVAKTGKTQQKLK